MKSKFIQRNHKVLINQNLKDGTQCCQRSDKCAGLTEFTVSTFPPRQWPRLVPNSRSMSVAKRSLQRNKLLIFCYSALSIGSFNFHCFPSQVYLICSALASIFVGMWDSDVRYVHKALESSYVYDTMKAAWTFQGAYAEQSR